MGKTYYSIICEELCMTGGKIIHLEQNVGNIQEACQIINDNVTKYPNGKWEIYLMSLK